MRNVKKLLALLLAMLVLCQGTLLVFAEETAETAEWTYDNSMLVKINTEEAKIFTPGDFPDTNCTEVLTTEKLLTETGYSYELMLIFDTSNDFDWQSTADAFLENGTVSDVYRNHFCDDYDSREQVCIINETEVRLRVGESADLCVTYASLETNWCNFDFCGVLFIIDPEIIDESTLQPDSFSRYGVEEFFTEGSCFMGDPEFGLDRYHKYVYLCDDIGRSIEVIQNLADVEGLRNVTAYYKAHPAGNPFAEFWTVEDENIASIALIGGDNGGYDYTETPLNQIATVTGLSEGATTVTVERSGFGAEASAVCTVIVSADGDVNSDGVINSLDAALVLKYDSDLIDETQLALDNADMNRDGEINSLDAAFILRYDAELE